MIKAMPGKESSDYRLYLEQRLKSEDEKYITLSNQLNILTTSINGQFIALNDRVDLMSNTLSEIKTQTKITNGRVTDLEEFQEEVDDIIKEREVKCPNVKKITDVSNRIEKLETRLENVMFFAKNPKIFIGIIVFLVMASIASTVIYYNSLKDTIKSLQKNTSYVEQLK